MAQRPGLPRRIYRRLVRVRPLDVGVAVLVLGAVAVLGLPALRDLNRTDPGSVTDGRPRTAHGTASAPVGPTTGEAGPSATPLPAVLAAPTFAVGVPGPVTPDCVRVGTQPRLRSGQFVVAGFPDYRHSWAPGRGSPKPLRVTPLHLPRAGNGLSVLALRVAGDPPSFGRFTTDPADWHAAAGSFVVDLPLLAGGRWQVILGSGPDQGCFVLDLPATPAP